MGSAICRMCLPMECAVRSFTGRTYSTWHGLAWEPPHATLSLSHPHPSHGFALMTISLADMKRYPDAATLAARLADAIAAGLSQAIAQRGLASLVVSGGNSPKQFFQVLQHPAARLEPRLRRTRRRALGGAHGRRQQREAGARQSVARCRRGCALRGPEERGTLAGLGCSVGLGNVCPCAAPFRRHRARHGR